MNNRHTILFLLTFILILSGCNNLTSNNEEYKKDVNINITKIEFEPDHKHFRLDVEINDTLTDQLLSTSADSIHFKTEEFLKGNIYDPKTQPQLISYENLKLKEIAKLKLDALFLIDLTLDSTAISQQYQIIKNLKRLFALEHLPS